MAHLSYTQFKAQYGDLGLTKWVKFNWLGIIPGSPYQQVAWLQSHAQEYINLGADFDCDSWELDVQYNSIPGQEAAVIGRQTQLEIFAQTGTRQNYSLWKQGATTLSSDVLCTERATVSYNYLTKEYKVNDYTKTATATYGKPQFLFTYYLTYSRASAKIYSFVTYKDGAINHNLVPHYRKSDNEPGMLDLITNVFYPNASATATRTFEVGPDVNI